MLHVILESNALDEFHDDIFNVFTHGNVVNVDDIRVGEHRNGLRFVDETLDRLLVRGNFVLEDLYGNGAAHQHVLRTENDRHTADADEPVDAVAIPESPADILFVCVHILSFFAQNLYADEECRDVIVSTAAVSGFDQHARLDRQLVVHIDLAPDDREDLVILQQVGKAVGAKQEIVFPAAVGLHPENIRLDLGVNADGTRDDVLFLAFLVCFSFLVIFFSCFLHY